MTHTPVAKRLLQQQEAVLLHQKAALLELQQQQQLFLSPLQTQQQTITKKAKTSVVRSKLRKQAKKLQKVALLSKVVLSPNTPHDVPPPPHPPVVQPPPPIVAADIDLFSKLQADAFFSQQETVLCAL